MKRQTAVSVWMFLGLMSLAVGCAAKLQGEVGAKSDAQAPAPVPTPTGGAPTAEALAELEAFKLQVPEYARSYGEVIDRILLSHGIRRDEAVDRAETATPRWESHGQWSPWIDQFFVGQKWSASLRFYRSREGHAAVSIAVYPQARGFIHLWRSGDFSLEFNELRPFHQSYNLDSLGRLARLEARGEELFGSRMKTEDCDDLASGRFWNGAAAIQNVWTNSGGNSISKSRVNKPVLPAGEKVQKTAKGTITTVVGPLYYRQCRGYEKDSWGCAELFPAHIATFKKACRQFKDLIVQ